jgi:hypothetical protein
MTDQPIIEIARATHEVNRVYCWWALGDDSQTSWDEAPKWQQDSAVEGVRAILGGATTTPEEQHQAWMKQKLSLGWTYGAVKDPIARTHPCLLPFADLPVEQQMKDTIFRAVVNGMRGDTRLYERPPRFTQDQISNGRTPLGSDVGRHVEAMDAYIDDLENRLAEFERNTPNQTLIDTKIDDILTMTDTHAVNLSGVESALWALLSLRGEVLHGDADGTALRKAYNDLKKTVGVTGSGVVCACIGDGAPSTHPKVMTFYQAWVARVRRIQDGQPDEQPPWRGLAEAMLEELHVAMAKRPGARTGQDVIDSVSSWLRTHPTAGADSLQYELEKMLNNLNLYAHRSACEVVTKLFAASFAWTKPREEE